MKFVVLFCLFALTYGAPSTKNGGRILSNQLREILEKLRITMKEGNPETGLPVMDPLDLETFGFELGTENKFTIQVTAGGIHLTGLSDFEVTNVDFSMVPLGLKYDITMPMSILSTETYNLKGLVFGALPIYGNGKAYFEVGNLRFSGFAALQVKDSEVSVKNLGLKIAVESLKSLTTGMLGGGDIDDVINALISDLAVEFFDSYSDIITGKIEETVVARVNKLLEGMTLNDLIDLINGNKEY